MAVATSRKMTETPSAGQNPASGLPSRAAAASNRFHAKATISAARPDRSNLSRISNRAERQASNRSRKRLNEPPTSASSRPDPSMISATRNRRRGACGHDATGEAQKTTGLPPGSITGNPQSHRPRQQDHRQHSHIAAERIERGLEEGGEELRQDETSRSPGKHKRRQDDSQIRQKTDRRGSGFCVAHARAYHAATRLSAMTSWSGSGGRELTVVRGFRLPPHRGASPFATLGSQAGANTSTTREVAPAKKTVNPGLRRISKDSRRYPPGTRRCPRRLRSSLRGRRRPGARENVARRAPAELRSHSCRGAGR